MLVYRGRLIRAGHPACETLLEDRTLGEKTSVDIGSEKPGAVVVGLEVATPEGSGELDRVKALGRRGADNGPNGPSSPPLRTAIVT